eukprot:6405375-Ditylum_brightwellii.AAC.1
MSDTAKYALESYNSDRFDTESSISENDSDSTVATLTYVFRSGSNNAVIGASKNVHPHANSVQRYMLKQHISRIGKSQLTYLHFLQRKKQVVEFFNEVFSLSKLKKGRDTPSMFDNYKVKTALYNVINSDEYCKRENNVFIKLGRMSHHFKKRTR